MPTDEGATKVYFSESLLLRLQVRNLSNVVACELLVQDHESKWPD